MYVLRKNKPSELNRNQKYSIINMEILLLIYILISQMMLINPRSSVGQCTGLESQDARLDPDRRTNISLCTQITCRINLSLDVIFLRDMSMREISDIQITGTFYV